MLLRPLVMWMSGYSALMRRQHSANTSSAVWSVDSVTTSGSMCSRLGAMPYCFALAMMAWNTSMRFSTELGMPSLSHSSATHCQSVSAMTGKMVSILSPSIDTELISPGLRQKGSARTQVLALGLSMQMGTSVTAWMLQIIHTRVSTSTASSTEAHTSR